MDMQVLFSSKTGNWATPQEFFDRLNEEFKFTLDPCADVLNHKCEKYYTEEQDGIKQDWSGERVFCNPPYGREVSKWVKKCFEETYCGKCQLAVLLLPARTDIKWFHKYIYHKSEVRFVSGRLKFGGINCSAPFPSMVVIFRGDMR